MDRRKMENITAIALLILTFGGFYVCSVPVESDPVLYNIAMLDTTTVTANNTYGGDMTLDNAHDGNNYTLWGGYSNTGVWIEYDFGKAYNILEVDVALHTSDFHRRNFEIIGYADPRDGGTVLGSQGSTAVDAAVEVWKLPLTGTQNFRYIRLHKTDADDMAIGEFMVYADASQVQPPSPSPTPSINPKATPDASLINIATFSTTTVTGDSPDKLPMIHDGDPVTLWDGYNTAGAKVEYDLGSSYSIRQIELDLHPLDIHRKNFKIIGYKDPKDAGTVLGIQDNTVADLTWVLNVDPSVKYRYITMMKTAGGAEDMAIYEFKVLVDLKDIPKPSLMVTNFNGDITDGEDNVASATKEINLTFSRAMNPATLTKDNIKLFKKEGDSSMELQYTGALVNTNGYKISEISLSPLTSYYILIRGGVTDANGIPFTDTEWRLNFKTGNAPLYADTLTLQEVSATQYKAVASIRNDYTDNKQAVLVVACYQGGAMTGIACNAATVNAHSTLALEQTIDLPSDKAAGNYTVKTFVLESLESMNPISDVVSE